MRLVKIIGLIALGAVIGGIAVLAILNPDTSAQTSHNGKYENLRPRRYKTSLENFALETEKIIPSLTTYGQNWKLVSRSSDTNSALIKAEVPVLIFTDDLEIKAESHKETGEIIVNVYSSQRVGLNDWGENRRHVLQILEALDERFN